MPNQMATMTQKADRLARIIFDTSFRHSKEPSFPLASGIMSQYYIDCKMALSHPEARELIGELIADRIHLTEVDAVGGMELGAYPIAVAVSDAMFRKHGKNLRALVVRKQPKGHGLKKHIEGDVRPADKVLVVDDVVTSGKSTIDAVAKIRDAGLEVVKVVVIVDREESGGRANIENCGTSLDALLTLSDLKALISG